jgi:hypothetical protein
VAHETSSEENPNGFIDESVVNQLAPSIHVHHDPIMDMQYIRQDDLT